MVSSAKKNNYRSLKWIGAAVAVLTVVLCANLVLNWIGSLPGISIKTVSIKGTLNRVTASTLEATVKRAVKGNFFTVDMGNVRAEFEKVTWVRNAAVRRLWPDRLEITIEEHVPLARWGTNALIDAHGEIFNAGYTGELPRFGGPVGSEREVVEAYRDFSGILKEAELEPREVLLSPRRAWQVKLTNGMVLDLGRVEMHARLARFVAVSKLTPELKDRKGRADLRYSNGFALKLTGPVKLKDEIKISK